MTNRDCETCTKTVCPDECFDRHPGSKIALKKLAKKLGVEITVVGP